MWHQILSFRCVFFCVRKFNPFYAFRVKKINCMFLGPRGSKDHATMRGLAWHARPLTWNIAVKGTMPSIIWWWRIQIQRQRQRHRRSPKKTQHILYFRKAGSSGILNMTRPDQVRPGHRREERIQSRGPNSRTCVLVIMIIKYFEP